ncbi:nuclear transport factor 2 family protein [uncultured Kordia sp.]|uniref:nuclear transport factor 2 family protein n=1 Tax=uncultured Kordia sp. TaxID=507699 RepID=UPI00262062F6|nr:nuclear transport factor 2 family protein [uncultured Kordia sp.]
MNFRSILIFVFSVSLMVSCAENNSESKNKTNTEDTAKTKSTTKTESTPKTKDASNSKNESSNSRNETSEALVASFVEARNNYDLATLTSLAVEDYTESFRNEIVEVKNRAELLRNLDWAKELSSKVTIKEVISANESEVVVIEEGTNYINVALKRKARSFKTTYFLKDGKVLKQSFDNAPGEVFDGKENDRVYGDFERYCKVNNIQFSWRATKEDGKTLRKALEKYANRKE